MADCVQWQIVQFDLKKDSVGFFFGYCMGGELLDVLAQQEQWTSLKRGFHPPP